MIYFTNIDVFYAIIFDHFPMAVEHLAIKDSDRCTWTASVISLFRVINTFVLLMHRAAFFQIVKSTNKRRLVRRLLNHVFHDWTYMKNTSEDSDLKHFALTAVSIGNGSQKQDFFMYLNPIVNNNSK